MPIRANSCQSGANQGPIFRFDTNSPICQSLPIHANPCQSVPIHVNPCQSGANRGPIFCSNTNSPIYQSWPIRANPCQSCANPVPIGSQFFVPTQIRQFADRGQSVPIRVNPCQSMPIRANPVPILKAWFSCCYALVMD